MTVSEPLRPQEVGQLLAAMPVMMGAEIQALPAGVAGWRHGADEWTVAEVLGHLIEAERRGFAGRIRTMLGEEPPRFATWDPAAVALARRDAERGPTALLAEFAVLRANSVALVGGLNDDDLRRHGEHPDVGTLTVGDLLHEWVHHDRNHLRQLLAISQSAAWQHMGNARRFSEPDGAGAAIPL